METIENVNGNSEALASASKRVPRKSVPRDMDWSKAVEDRQHNSVTVIEATPDDPRVTATLRGDVLTITVNIAKRPFKSAMGKAILCASARIALPTGHTATVGMFAPKRVEYL